MNLVIILFACILHAALCKRKLRSTMVGFDDFGLVGSNLKYQMPPSGLITLQDTQNKDLWTIKLVKKINSPSTCKQLKFAALPEENTSPLVGGNVFSILDDMYNNRPAWTNGVEILSFIPNDSDGTWLVGPEAGVDSGFVFLKPSQFSMTPLSLESSEVQWNWLLKSKWISQEYTRLECMDNESLADQSFYSVEYFEKDSHNAQNSFLVSVTSPNIETNVPKFKLWDMQHQLWIEMSFVRVVCEMGGPVLLAVTKKGDNSKLRQIAHLVNEEHASNGGWQLTFKHGIPMYEERVSLPDELDEEVVVVRTHEPVAEGVFTALSAKLLEQYEAAQTKLWSDVSVGDFVWVWYSAEQAAESFAQEVLLECVASAEVSDDSDVISHSAATVTSRKAFKYYASDRRDVMHQSVLSKDTNYFTVSTFDDNKNIPVVLQDENGVSLNIRGVFNLGSDMTGYLEHYLEAKEGLLGGMSSCYLYHAAVSMPRSLVYAAEVLCVLLGAKPLTMIQYTSPSDHQWKFPLVQSLVQRIVSRKTVLQDHLDVAFQVNKYNKDETLVIYRTNRKYLVDALMPGDQSAQALHPLPYPNHDNAASLQRDYELQIYYAWWNGYVLGYPEHFIDSYCLTFHNDLSDEGKMIQAKQAKKDVINYFRTRVAANETAVAIKMGNNVNVLQHALH